MSYRPVDEVFWTDPKVRALSPIEKFLFLYFITNPHASFTGVYYLPLPTILFETGLSEKEYRMGMDTLSVGYMVLEDNKNSIVWVVNMAKFQILSDKQRSGARKHLRTIQRSWILAKFAEKYPNILAESEYPTDTLPIPYPYPTDTKDRERETERETEYTANASASASFPDPKPTKEKRPKKATPCLDLSSVAIPADLKADQEWCDLWEEWQFVRASGKHRLTVQAAKVQLADMAEMGVEQAKRAIKNSISSGWRGIFKPTGSQPQAKSEKAKNDETEAWLRAGL